MRNANPPHERSRAEAPCCDALFARKWRAIDRSTRLAVCGHYQAAELINGYSGYRALVCACEKGAAVPARVKGASREAEAPQSHRALPAAACQVPSCRFEARWREALTHVFINLSRPQLLE